MAVPKIGFVSLGCPKALSDSERILSRLRAEGYGVSKSYGGAGLVVVNTCGFINSAIDESLEAIGEAFNDYPRPIREERRARLMALQEGISGSK